jgi:hypothetical protein
VSANQRVSRILVHSISIAKVLPPSWIVSAVPIAFGSHLIFATIANVTEHKRNHIMGHVRGDVFRYYVNQIVDVDTQSIFLETPSRDALIKLSSNSSLTRDPSAPQDLDDKHKKSIESNPELLELTDRRNALRRDIIAKYQKICRSKGTNMRM